MIRVHIAEVIEIDQFRFAVADSISNRGDKFVQWNGVEFDTREIEPDSLVKTIRRSDARNLLLFSIQKLSGPLRFMSTGGNQPRQAIAIRFVFVKRASAPEGFVVRMGGYDKYSHQQIQSDSEAKTHREYLRWKSGPSLFSVISL